MTVLWVLSAVAVVFVLYGIGLFNALVALRNQVRNAWSQIDVQLKRRYDLIPNLIETVKGYVKHERETLENITQARSRAMGAEGVADKAKAEGALSGAVSRLMVTLENYPDLKANRNFIALQEELSSTENKIAFSRQNYNDQTLAYNNKIQMFPSNWVAGAFGFVLEEFFRVEDATEKQAPKVNFS